MVAGVALVDIEVAGHTCSDIVDDVVSDAKLADFKGSCGTRIA